MSSPYRVSAVREPDVGSRNIWRYTGCPTKEQMIVDLSEMIEQEIRHGRMIMALAQSKDDLEPWIVSTERVAQLRSILVMVKNLP